MVSLRHLETFVVVADELHFGRAAERLHVAQPAVSQTIRALERDLGATLFDRSSRSVRLTAAGESYLTDAHDVLQRLDRASSRALDAHAGVRGRVRVGYTAVCSLGGLASAVASFADQYPDVDVELEHLGTAEQAEQLRQHIIDVGFGILPGGPEPVHAEIVAPDELRVFHPTGHDFAGRERVPVSALLRQPLLLMSREREPCVHQLVSRLSDEHQIQRHIALEVDHLESMMAFARSGAGVGLAPGAAAQLHLDGLTSRPLEPAVPAGVSMMWHPATATPTTELFLDTAREVLAAQRIALASTAPLTEK
ncbi:MAG: LysR substrate-binding domain-containing protein [Actinomycetota bacterium]